MKLSAPKQITFWVAVVVVLVAIIAKFVTISFLTDNALWVAVIGFVILALGNLLEGF
jgi:hypothetical protein